MFVTTSKKADPRNCTVSRIAPGIDSFYAAVTGCGGVLLTVLGLFKLVGTSDTGTGGFALAAGAIYMGAGYGLHKSAKYGYEQNRTV